MDEGPRGTIDPQPFDYYAHVIHRHARLLLAVSPITAKTPKKTNKQMIR